MIENFSKTLNAKCKRMGKERGIRKKIICNANMLTMMDENKNKKLLSRNEKL